MPRKSQQPPERSIYNRIRVLRAETGLSRAELAAQVGVNPQTVGALERGEHNPSLLLAMNISDAFGVPIDAVFSRTPFRSISDSYRRAEGATSDGGAS